MFTISKNGQQLSPSHLYFPFFFPLSLRYNITHSSNFNFYHGTTHFKKKIISNFIVLARPLSLKLIFHYHTQNNRQRDRVIRMQQSTYKFFSSLFFFIFSSSTLLCFLLFFRFFPRRSAPLIVAGLFLFLFLFTSFNSSIFLCPSPLMSCCDA